MANLVPLVNGVSHAWADIAVMILNTPVAGITGVKYEEKQEMTDNYGAGSRPVSRGYGRIETTASITLSSEELLALVKAAPQKRLQLIPPFDIIVAYMPLNSTNITTDILKNCQFKVNSRDVKEGDTKISVECELICSHIEWDK